MNYLDLASVLGLHESTIQSHGGEAGLISLGLIESAVESARQTFDSQPLYSTIEEVATAYWYSLTMNHGFVDGNKRTAILAVLYFLEMNRCYLAYPDKELRDVCLQVASHSIEREDLLEFVRVGIRRADSTL